jgi:hypothetical protein
MTLSSYDSEKSMTSDDSGILCMRIANDEMRRALPVPVGIVKTPVCWRRIRDELAVISDRGWDLEGSHCGLGPAVAMKGFPKSAVT